MPSLAHSHNTMAGNFHVKKDDVVAGRYKVISEAGAGNFARVLKAEDMQENNQLVAVKILRKEYSRDAQFENAILTAINKCDTADSEKVCKMKSHFTWGGLPCFVFKLLGPSLKSCSYGDRNHDEKTLVKFAAQSCKALSFLHFTCKLIHTDLKPENILLDGQPQPGMRGIGNGWSICDLGSASFFSAKPDQDLIQTRPYRAPEVVLGMPWSYAVDMWSVGCILYELRRGVKLFDAMNDEQQLIMFEKRIGKVPGWMTRGAHPKCRAYFDHHDRLVHAQSVFSNPYGTSNKSLRRLEDEFADEPDFLDFLLQCFQYDPLLRMRADEALHHPWVKEHFPPAEGLIRKLPTSAYTSGLIKTPSSQYLNGDQPISAQQKEKLIAVSAPSSAATSRSSSPSILSRPPSSSDLARSSSDLMRHHGHVIAPSASHNQPAAHAHSHRISDEQIVAKHAADALRHQAVRPAAGMPSSGRAPRAAQQRGPLMAPVNTRPSPPVPPHNPYATTSSAYGSTLRVPYPGRSIPSPDPSKIRGVPPPVMTPHGYAAN